jgi:hypothetical protein
MDTKTMLRPLGGETYLEIPDLVSSNVVLTYNDLWMLIVCRTSLDGDWVRLRQAASMVYDPLQKQAVVDRLWTLEQRLDGLPEIPTDVKNIHMFRAHQWFKQRPVRTDKNW